MLHNGEGTERQCIDLANFVKITGEYCLCVKVGDYKFDILHNIAY